MKLDKVTTKVLKPIFKFRVFVISVFLVANIVVLLRPYLLGKLLDHINSPVKILIQFSVVIIILLILDFLLDWLQNFLWFKMIYKGIYLLRSEMYRELIKNHYSMFSKSNSGDIVNRIINDTAQYAEKRLITAPMLLMNLSTLVIVLFFVFKINLVIGLVLLICSILYFFSYRNINYKLKDYSLAERKSYSNLLHTATKLYDGIQTIKLFQKEDYFSSIYQAKVLSQCNQSIHLQKWKSLAQSLSSLLINTMPILSTIIGIYLLSIGKCTIGAIFSIYSYTSFLGEPIRNLTDYNIIVQQSKAVEERLDELIPQQTDIITPKITCNNINMIEINHISFSYTYTSILDNISIVLKPGDRLGITGPSGSGKSTLLKLLTGQLKPTCGSIVINSSTDNSKDISSYINRIAVLSQEVFLYDDTIMNNINFGREINNKRANSILSTFEINSFLNRNIDELSGGEKKRVGLARTLLGDYDILILDEPTSDVDENMESKIISFIDQFLVLENKMLIVITHRPSILNICNKFIKLT